MSREEWWMIDACRRHHRLTLYGWWRWLLGAARWKWQDWLEPERFT